MSTQFPLTSHNFRFYGPFPVYISFIFNKSQIWSNLTYDSSKWSVKPENYFQKKKFGLGVKLQISGHLGSNFKIHWKLVNCISKWRSWRQLFEKRGHEVNKGHPRSKIPKIGQISKVIESEQIVYQNDAFDVSFQKKGSLGQQRSPEVKNSENRSYFKSHWKWVSCISKWRSWRQLSDERCHEVIIGHLRSKISTKVIFRTLINYISKWRSWRLPSKKVVARSFEVTNLR